MWINRPESADSSFRWEDLQLKTNSELLSNLGNFINRALKFSKENFAGEIKDMKLSGEKGDFSLITMVNRYLRSYVEQVSFKFSKLIDHVFHLFIDKQMEQCREREAISNILNISRVGNQFMQAEKPWYEFYFSQLLLIWNKLQ